jgi:hypothetical protein
LTARRAAVDEVSVLQQALELLSALPPQARERILHTIRAFFGLPSGQTRSGRTLSSNEVSPSDQQPELFSDTRAPGRFSDRESLTPKQFLLEKEPRTDIERVACLAFYLTHYRDTPHFKTIDISKLNTEAAQAKFSNAAYAVDNATKSGYLVPASRGHKQLSATGEQFVQALPDRARAKTVIERSRAKRHRRTRRSRART